MAVDAKTAAEITTVHMTRVDMMATAAEFSAVTVTVMPSLDRVEVKDGVGEFTLVVGGEVVVES